MKITTPILDQLCHDLREYLRDECKTGQRLPGDRLLAGRFGVSNVTLREAMLRLAAEGLVERRPRSGTYVCDPARSGRIALVTGIDLFHPRVSRYFHLQMRALRRHLTATGFSCSVYVGHTQPGEHPPCHEVDPEFLAQVEAGTLRGVVVQAVGLDPRWLEPLQKARIPVVAIGERDYPNRVSGRLEPALTQAVAHWAGAGRSRFALLTFDPRHTEVPTAGEPVVDVFRNALQSTGLTVNPRWIRDHFHPALAGAGWEQVREIWLADQSAKPDVLIITDEVLLADAIQAIQALGIRVPEELAIVAKVTNGLSLACPWPVDRLLVDVDATAVQVRQLLQARLLTPDAEPVQRLLPVTYQPAHEQIASTPFVLSPIAETITQELEL